MPYELADVNPGYQYSDNMILKVWEAHLKRIGCHFFTVTADDLEARAPDEPGQGGGAAAAEPEPLADEENVFPCAGMFKSDNSLTIENSVVIALDKAGVVIGIIAEGVTHEGRDKITGDNRFKHIKKAMELFAKSDRNTYDCREFIAFFPFNANNNHWNLAELQIHMDEDYYVEKIALILMEPLYENRYIGHYPGLHSCLMDAYQTAARHDVTPSDVGLTVVSTKQQHAEGSDEDNPAVSCGPICAENGLRRLCGEGVDLQATLKSGAVQLRLSQLNLVDQPSFAERQRDVEVVRHRLSADQKQLLQSMAKKFFNSLSEEQMHDLSRYTDGKFRDYLRKNRESLGAISSESGVTLDSLIFKEKLSDEFRNDYIDGGQVALKLRRDLPRQVVEIDDNDSSDEEGYYEEIDNGWSRFVGTGKSPSKKSRNAMAEIGCELTSLRILFMVSSFALKLLYNQSVNEYYRQTGGFKQKLGTDSLPKDPALRSWVAEAIENTLKIVVLAGNKQDEEKLLGDEEIKDRIDSVSVMLTKNKTAAIFKDGIKKFESYKKDLAEVHVKNFFIAGKGNKNKKHKSFLKSIKKPDAETRSADRKLCSRQISEYRFQKKSYVDKRMAALDLLKHFPDDYLINPSLRASDEKMVKKNDSDLFRDFDYYLFSELVSLRVKHRIFKLKGISRQPHYDLTDGWIAFMSIMRVINRHQKRVRDYMRVRLATAQDCGSNSVESIGTVFTLMLSDDMYIVDRLLLDYSTKEERFSRTNFNVTGGTYKDMLQKIKSLCDNLGVEDRDIADWVYDSLLGKLKDNHSFVRLKESLTVLDGLSTIAEIIYQLFICEPIRYPSTLILSYMALRLIKDGKLTWANAIYRGDEGYKGGLIAMTMRTAQSVETKVNPHQEKVEKSKKADVPGVSAEINEEPDRGREGGKKPKMKKDPDRGGGKKPKMKKNPDQEEVEKLKKADVPGVSAEINEDPGRGGKKPKMKDAPGVVECARYFQDIFNSSKLRCLPVQYEYEGGSCKNKTNLKPHAKGVLKEFLDRTAELVNLWSVNYCNQSFKDDDHRFSVLENSIWRSLPSGLFFDQSLSRRSSLAK